MPAAFARVAGALQVLAHAFLHRGGRGQHLATRGIEHLRVDMAWRAVHGQPGNAQLTDMLPTLDGAARATFL
jgi:hypothetical protein